MSYNPRIERLERIAAKGGGGSQSNEVKMRKKL